MYDPKELLRSQVQSWWEAQHQHGQPDWLALGLPGEACRWGACDWRNGWTEDQLVESLRSSITAEAVQAANRLQQPDVRVALLIATNLLPTPFGQEINIVADLIEAAGAQTVQARNRALLTAGGTALILGGLWYFGRRAA